MSFASAPANVVAGTDLTFSSGAKAEVLSYDTTNRIAAVILDNPSTRLTATDTLDTPDEGQITGTAVGNAGTGYTSGSALATTGGTGSGATVDITVSVGAPATTSITSGGSTYGASGTNVATTGGTGSNLTVNFTSTGGVIDAVTISTAGTGYTVGDTITVTGGGNNATFTIASVTGVITAVSINGSGTGYSVADTVTIVQSGGASGTFTVSSVADSTIALTVEDWWTNTNTDGTKSANEDGKIKLSAIGPRPGTSAFAANLGLGYDEVHIGVIERSSKTVVERLQYLSKFTDGVSAEGASAYYPTIVKEASQYIYFGSHNNAPHYPTTAGAGVAAGTAATAANSGDKAALFGTIQTALTGGTDDYAYTVSEFQTGLELFNDKETVDVDYILMGGSMATEADTKLKAAACITSANLRKDAVAFISAHKGNQVSGTVALTRTAQKDNTVNFFSSLSSSSYAVFDSGYKYFYDRFNDSYRYVPCNGDIAGLCVATSTTLDDWFSPAGLSRGGVRNAIKLAYNPTQSDRDELYQNRINPVVSFPGQGITLFGDKTALSSPSAFDRINVRRLFINIEDRAEALAKAVIFEQNDDTTRLGFTNALTSYLSEVQARRGITDFQVVCDTTNNTPSVIDRNEFVAEVYVKPTRSINYITLSFVATRTGVSFSEVVGRA